MAYSGIQKVFILLLLGGGLIWAAPQPTPSEVARQFWQRVADGNTTAAAALTVRGAFDPATPVPIRMVKISTWKGRHDRGIASVPTTLRYRIDIKGVRDAECNATFATELLRIDGAWRVDALATTPAYRDAVQKGATHCLERLLDQSLDSVVDALRKEFEAGGKSWSERMQKSWQTWQEKMLKTLRELEKSLQSPPSAPPKLPPADQGEKI